jgi:hypothetical protein
MKLLEVAFILVFGIGFAGCSKNVGGLSSTYPAKDFDPTLSAEAKKAFPLIDSIDRYLAKNGHLPSSLSDVGVSSIDQIYYMPESDHYTIMIKLGWDPSLNYDSSDKSWTFDSGDGKKSKPIKIQT